MVAAAAVARRGSLLLFVTVNDHLTLALKSFTGRVRRKESGREQKGSPFITRGTEEGKREQPEQRMDG